MIRANLGLLGVGRVPNLLAVDSDGTVLAIRTGSVSAASADTVIRQLTSGTTRRLYERIARNQMESYARGASSYQIVALREPKSLPFAGARYTVIPYDELGVRATYELSPDVTTFVDCDTAVSVFECQEALLTLAQGRGFSHLLAVNLPSRRQSAQRQ